MHPLPQKHAKDEQVIMRGYTRYAWQWGLICCVLVSESILWHQLQSRWQALTQQWQHSRLQQQTYQQQASKLAHFYHHDMQRRQAQMWTPVDLPRHVRHLEQSQVDNNLPHIHYQQLPELSVTKEHLYHGMPIKHQTVGIRLSLNSEDEAAMMHWLTALESSPDGAIQLHQCLWQRQQAADRSTQQNPDSEAVHAECTLQWHHLSFNSASTHAR